MNQTGTKMSLSFLLDTEKMLTFNGLSGLSAEQSSQ